MHIVKPLKFRKYDMFFYAHFCYHEMKCQEAESQLCVKAIIIGIYNSDPNVKDKMNVYFKTYFEMFRANW